jgi:hypothetical protein
MGGNIPPREKMELWLPLLSTIEDILYVSNLRRDELEGIKLCLVVKDEVIRSEPFRIGTRKDTELPLLGLRKKRKIEESRSSEEEEGVTGAECESPIPAFVSDQLEEIKRIIGHQTKEINDLNTQVGEVWALSGLNKLKNHH